VGRCQGLLFVMVGWAGLGGGCGSSSSPPGATRDGGGTGSSSSSGSSSGASSGSSSSSGGGQTAGDDGGPTGSPDASPGADGALPLVEAGPPPAMTCTATVGPADTSHPTTVVGNGDAATCTLAALQSAVTQGGVVTFDCGGAATIAVTTEITVPTDRDTVIDGGGMVTLDGGATTRILHFSSGDYRGMYGGAQHTLTVQRITLTRGKATGTMMFPAASPPCSQGYQDGAGGAILVTSGTLHVIDATFTNNQAEDIGPDVGGGAIYTTGSVDTTIVGSQFDGNSASNGGAVGSLNSDLTLINDTFSQNQALGQGANSTNGTCPVVGGQRETGSGGNGGAVSIDGGDDGTLTVCGCTFSKNSGHAIGGAIFRTPDGAKQTSNIDRTTFDGNTCSGTYNGSATGQAGAMYFHNSHVVLTNSTVSNNSAPGSGGFFGDGTDLDATNTTFAANVATTGVGGAIASSGTLTNCTFANNEAHGTNYAAFAAALFGGPWTVQNTIFDGNTDNDNSGSESCSSGTSNTGDHDLQWPMGGTDTPCVPGITFADAMLGPLADNGGTTLTAAPAAAATVIQTGTGCPATDQTGRARANPCTLGALEAH
jgi:predicted outer membrane repeat protein